MASVGTIAARAPASDLSAEARHLRWGSGVKAAAGAGRRAPSQAMVGNCSPTVTPQATSRIPAGIPQPMGRACLYTASISVMVPFYTKPEY